MAAGRLDRRVAAEGPVVASVHWHTLLVRISTLRRFRTEDKSDQFPKLALIKPCTALHHMSYVRRMKFKSKAGLKPYILFVTYSELCLKQPNAYIPFDLLRQVTHLICFASSEVPFVKLRSSGTSAVASGGAQALHGIATETLTVMAKNTYPVIPSLRNPTDCFPKFCLGVVSWLRKCAAMRVWEVGAVINDLPVHATTSQ